MALNKNDFIAIIQDVVIPFVEKKIKEEVADRVHEEAMRLAHSEAGDLFRQALQEEFDHDVSVRVRICGKAA